MEGPKISIITVCFNTADTIEKTIQSVINQTYSNIEYIIVDGASTDDTMQIVGQYSERIDTVVSEKDKGIYDAYNKGLHLATGDYVQYLNANDYLASETAISDVVAGIISANNPEVVYGAVYHCNPVTGFIRRYNEAIIVEQIEKGLMLPFPATFIQREVMLSVGGFSLDYPILADYDLVARITKLKPRLTHLDGVYVSVFLEGGISTQYSNFPIIEAEREKIIGDYFNASYEKRIIPNESYYKKWVAAFIVENKSVAHILSDRHISNIAIFGAGETSNLIAYDCTNNHINVHSFIDNDVRKQNLNINGIPVNAISWLQDNSTKLDAVVLGFEGHHEDAVRQQIAQLNLQKEIEVISWRALVSYLF